MRVKWCFEWWSPSSEVLKHWGLHVVVTEVVPVGCGVDSKRILVLFGIQVRD